MAVLLRGLRAGRALRALGSGMVTPQCSRVQRGFRQAARLRLPDDFKTEQQTPTASSSSSLAQQQHSQAHQSEPETASALETPAPEQAMPESESAPLPDVVASAPTHEAEDSAAPASEVEACARREQDVTDPPPSPGSTSVQGVSASVSDPEASVHTPELETSASAQEVPESAPAQEVPESAPEEEASEEAESAQAGSASEGAASAQAGSASASEGAASAQAGPASEQEASEPERSHTDQESEGDESDGYESEEELQARILSTALEFVPQHGWSAEAIAAAAETLGLSSAAAGMFTNGAGDLILHFISQSNAQLAQILAEYHNQVQQGQAEPKETAEFLRYAVEARLRMLIPHIDSWPQAMSILLLPHNIPNSLKHLSTLIDDIWYYAGDRSTDMNWYTRRAALTGVYNTTELVMLQDSSPDFQDTWAFLDKRIQDIVNMANTAKQVQATGEAVLQGIMGAAVTLSSLAGINQQR